MSQKSINKLYVFLKAADRVTTWRYVQSKNIFSK